MLDIVDKGIIYEHMGMKCKPSGRLHEHLLVNVLELKV